MVHGLETPHHVPGLAIQRHDRIGIAIVADAVAAKIIGTRARRRQEDKAARLVDRDCRPDICMPGPRCRSVCPGRLRRVGQVLRHRIEPPFRRTRARIEGMHRAQRRLGAQIVADRRSRDHRIADDRRCRRDLVFARPAQVHARLDVHRTAITKVRTRRARPRIQCNQPRIQRRHVQARRTRSARFHSVVLPVGHAPAGELVRRIAGCVDTRAVAPALRAGAGIDRDHILELRTEDERSLDQDRRRLEGGIAPRRLAPIEGPRVKSPGNLEVLDIVRRDRSHRRIPRAPLVTPIGRPCLSRTIRQRAHDRRLALDRQVGREPEHRPHP